MKETDFYTVFSEKFKLYLQTYLPKNARIAYSCNKLLEQMIKDLEISLNYKIIYPDYIPKLKLDILFGIIINSKLQLILIEAKYLSKLSLKDYSQLSGYLQVAQNINIGLLLLIAKNYANNKLSNDFNEIISLNKLPMNWKMSLTHSEKTFSFYTGILYYQPNSKIEWINTQHINGISTFEELVKVLINANEVN